MKRKLGTAVCLMVMLWMSFGLVQSAFAEQNNGQQTNTVNSQQVNSVNRPGVQVLSNPLKWNDVNSLLNGLLDAILELGAVVAVLMIIYCGLKLVLAQGDPKKIEEAKHMFFYTVIGIAVLFGAKIIAAIITTTVKTIQG